MNRQLINLMFSKPVDAKQLSTPNGSQGKSYYLCHVNNKTDSHLEGDHHAVCGAQAPAAEAI
jgi:hypothetical protein